MTDERNLYEGDIILEPDQRYIIEQESNPRDPHAPQRAITRREDYRWPQGKVPYVISSSLSESLSKLLFF